MRVGVIGAGLIGNKRAVAVKRLGGQVLAVTDAHFQKARDLAQLVGAQIEPDWRSLVARADLDFVIIATSNDFLVPCALDALSAGKNIFVEKPGARNPNELQLLLDSVKNHGMHLGIGFNHRFHPAIQKAKKLIQSGEVGDILYIRARYGHGGRVGYDQEWRSNPAISGGGELLDQGMHLIDLSYWFGGEFQLEYGVAKTLFWKMPVDDNGFLLLKSLDGKRYSFLHASCTEWKNLFDFEIFCESGKIQIWGLGRSYGMEEFRYYKMKSEMGPPDLVTESFPGEDFSWDLELQAFEAKIQGKSSDVASGEDALRAIKIVYETYGNSGMGWVR